jgi:ABC-type amino acid transport system permease subunit
MKQFAGNCSSSSETFSGVLRDVLSNPYEMVIRRWNWKSAVFSSLCRALVFLLVNLNAGLHAASGAMLAEFLYRACTAGFCGSLTQTFRKAHPRWAAAVLIPVCSHVLEFFIHWYRGTPNLRVSILASLGFTVISTLFNLHAMRRGVLVVGAESKSIAGDMRAMPREIFTFLKSGMGLLSAAESQEAS